jgi:hypothetical protein
LRYRHRRGKLECRVIRPLTIDRSHMPCDHSPDPALAGAQPLGLRADDMADEVLLVVRTQLDELGGKSVPLSLRIGR